MRAKLNIHLIFVLLAASLWGTAGLFVRAVEQTDITEMQLVFGRALFSVLALGAIILFLDKRLFKINLKDIWLFVCAGLFSIVLFNFSYYTTMSLTSLSVAAVLLYTAPFFVVIISLFLFGERLTLNKTVACIIAFIGCCFVSGLFNSEHRISGKALFFGLLTGLGYALYTIFGKLLLKRKYSSFTITFYVFAFAAVCCLPFINTYKTAVYLINEPKAVVIVFLMAIFNTVIPYILYTKGLEGVEPSVAPIIATIEPVVATVVGAAVFSEAITVWGAVGIILVLISVVILNINPVTVTANAKINLTLAVTGKREDGYHTVDTLMQSVTLADTVTVLPAKKTRVICSDGLLSGEENIAFKAAKLFFEKTAIKSGATVRIKKRIPQAAGLGGGSADAAAVLVALDKIYKTALSEEELCEMALALGADVPFFIKGGTVRAEGIGEKLSPIKHLKNGYILLAKADNKPSTKEMYARLDSEKPPLPDTESAINAIENNDINALGKALGNSFTCVWQKNKLYKRLYDFNSEGVSLSGSGPVWFALFAKRKSAVKAKAQLKKEKIECYLVKPSDYALKLE